jgi:imidazoleglycerol-phosphate dehydratase
MADRIATVTRNTLESQITVTVNLDGTGVANFNTPVPFLNHMLDQIARHGLVDLDIQAVGDTHIDDHHTVEDIGITLGMAVAEAIGDKKGLTRYGHAYVPLDEAMSRVVMDFSGRPGLIMKADFVRSHVGTFDVDLTREFFQGFVNHWFQCISTISAAPMPITRSRPSLKPLVAPLESPPPPIRVWPVLCHRQKVLSKQRVPGLTYSLICLPHTK